MNTAYIQDGLALKLLRIACGRIFNVDEINGVLLRASPAQERDELNCIRSRRIAGYSGFSALDHNPYRGELGAGFESSFVHGDRSLKDSG
jgi:hypothetical protein